MVCAEDDYLTPDAVERLVDGMNGFDFVCANAWLMHDDGKQVPYKSQVPRNYRVLIEYNSIHGGTVMYRRNVLEAVGGMDETLWTAEEFDMNVRMLKTGFKLGYVDAFVQHNRIHDRSKSRTYMVDKEKRAERIFYIERLKSRLI
jgi:GT2 family glycosyltransferase